MSTDAATGISMTAPVPLTPAGVTIRYADQPVTLTVKNGVSTGSGSMTYTFEVASDAGFSQIVQTKDGVAEGASGQTSVALNTLAGNLTYWWRARATSGKTTSPNSASRAWTLGPEVTIEAPVLVSPGNGGTLNGTASLIVANATRSGPAGPISYRFEVSDSSSFGNIVFTSTVGEGNGQTSAPMTTQLTSNATYFWRVMASDPSNSVNSPFSSTFSFRYVPFDLRSATMVNSPPDFADWPEAAKITSINFSGGAFEVDFDRRDGPGRWPDVVPKGWAGALQYTLGMCVNINNHWYCSGVVQFWYGRTLHDSAPPSLVGREWFYDPARWSPMLGYQPRDGELVGLWVGSGNLRDGNSLTRATCPAVCERSNIALVPWSNGGGQSFTFGAGSSRRYKHLPGAPPPSGARSFPYRRDPPALPACPAPPARLTGGCTTTRRSHNRCTAAVPGRRRRRGVRRRRARTPES
jgi:hypothetical protein